MAAKVGELVPTATAALVVAILVVSAVPVYAEAQQPSAVQLKADAQNVFKIISGDKHKIRTYCKIADLIEQLARASRKQDTKKVEARSG